MNYKQALKVLESEIKSMEGKAQLTIWELAIVKAVQAIKDCLGMGLDGEGE